MKTKYILIVIVIILSFSTILLSNVTRINKGVSSQTTTLNISYKELECINKQTISSNSLYKIIYYINISYCAECSLKQLEHLESNLYKRNIPLIVILKIDEKKRNRILYYLKSLKLRSSIFVDVNDSFKKCNNFVIDEDDNVIIVNADNQVVANYNTLYDSELEKFLNFK